MKIIPVTFAYAKQFIKEHHRHNPNVVGCKFCIGLENMGGYMVLRYAEDL